ncbi:DUF4381 domain-containing protein [Lysobacter sp. FW306-1B-D06B]|uniref:DUF4381 domain-containing protein n=1 Tax=Lysobacter sp. FW306-1B-D06B TaxID=3140250 RepID=UPI003140BAF7
MAAGGLVLRDIHATATPSWWPPAPGWWVLAGVAIAAIVLLAWWRARARRRRVAIVRLFDHQVEAAPTPPQQVAAISELLRRAARRRDAAADTLQGEAWLLHLDAATKRPRKAPMRTDFSQGPGRLLLDGGFRRDVDPAEVDALRALARERFLQWMDAT